MSYELKLKVGNDTGNSEHDIIINNELICQPNVFAKSRKVPNLEELDQDKFIEKIENNLIVSLVSTKVSSGTYFVGEQALKSGQAVFSIEVGVDNKKAESDIVFVNTLAQIAGFAVKKAYKENKLDEYIKVKVDMTGALPINQYSREEGNKFANKFLDEVHSLIVATPKKNIKVEIEFEYVKIIQEGISTTFALEQADDSLFETYNKKVYENKVNEETGKKDFPYDEKIDKNYFLKNEVKILHISIGEGTSELPITIGKKYDPNFITGINNGVGHAIDKSLEEFKKAVSINNYSRQEFSKVMKDTKHKFNLLAVEPLEFYLEEQTSEILSQVKREIQKANNNIDMILVYGGGSILMRNSLEKELEKICERGKIKLLYLEKKDCVTIESQGLSNFTNSKLFELLKKNSK
ncbi:MAG: ParM/StbA family protein [Cetobacterium sp.]|nr:ParM/StbA family protein [Cetobacterium sp.]